MHAGRAAAKECRDQGIPVRVNTVCPGGVKTPMWTTMPFFRELVRKAGSEEAAFESLAGGVPGGRFAEPADVARAILFLASDESRFVTGVDLPVDGGYWCCQAPAAPGRPPPNRFPGARSSPGRRPPPGSGVRRLAPGWACW